MRYQGQRRKTPNRRRKSNPGKPKVRENAQAIETELHQAHQRLMDLSREPKAPDWSTIQDTLGHRISPRYEDREPIQQALALMPHASADERLALERFIRHAITQNALYRTQAMYTGWPIRIRLQEIVARARGAKRKRLEIVGRGENKIGFLATYAARVNAGIQSHESPHQIVEKAGYPTDLVIQSKYSSGRHKETWYVEVEPHGTRHFGNKVRRVNDALDHRFAFPHVIQKAYGRTLDHVGHQWPREFSRSAIVFYTGTHPLLSEAKKIHADAQATVTAAREPIAMTLRRDPALADVYKKAMKRFDVPVPLEVRIRDVLNRRDMHAEIQNSPRPVYWLIPSADQLHLIDLKRLIEKNDALLCDEETKYPELRERANRVVEENTRPLDLEKMRKARVLKTIAKIRWGETPRPNFE